MATRPYMMPDGADPCLGYRQQADTIARLREERDACQGTADLNYQRLQAAESENARLRERVAELEATSDALSRAHQAAEAELSSLKAAGTRADGIEAAAKVHEPSCSCPHPCDDYFIWPSPCHKKAAAVIRALSPAPEAKPFQSLDDLKKGNPVADQLTKVIEGALSRFGKEGR